MNGRSTEHRWSNHTQALEAGSQILSRWEAGGREAHLGGLKTHSDGRACRNHGLLVSERDADPSVEGACVSDLDHVDGLAALAGVLFHRPGLEPWTRRDLLRR